METEFLSTFLNQELSNKVSGSDKPVRRQDVYRRILGPTPDETILTGLQIVVDMCAPDTYVIPTSYCPSYQIKNEPSLPSESLKTAQSQQIGTSPSSNENKPVQVPHKVNTKPSPMDKTAIQDTYRVEVQPSNKETKPPQVTQNVGIQSSNLDIKLIQDARTNVIPNKDTIVTDSTAPSYVVNYNAQFKTTATQDIVPVLEYNSNFEQTSLLDYVECPYYSKEVNTSSSLQELVDLEQQPVGITGVTSVISSDITIDRTKTRVLENFGLGDASMESTYTEGALTSSCPQKSISAYWNIKSSDCVNTCSCSTNASKNHETEVAAVELASWNANSKIPLRANSSISVEKRKTFSGNKSYEVGNERHHMPNRRKPSFTQCQRSKASFTPSNSTYCSNIINKIPTLAQLNDECIQVSKYKHGANDVDYQFVEKSSTCRNINSFKNRVKANRNKENTSLYYVDNEVRRHSRTLNADEESLQAKTKHYKYEPTERMTSSRLIQFAGENYPAMDFYKGREFDVDNLKETVTSAHKAHTKSALDGFKSKIVSANDDWSFNSQPQSLTPQRCHSVQTIVSLGSDKSSYNYLNKFYLSLQKQFITKCVQTTASSSTSTHVQTYNYNPVSKGIQTSSCESNAKSRSKLEMYSAIFQGPQSSEPIKAADYNYSLIESSKHSKSLKYSVSQQSIEMSPSTGAVTLPSRKSIVSPQSSTKKCPPALKSRQSDRFSYLYCRLQSAHLKEPQNRSPSFTARSFDKSKLLHVKGSKSRKRASVVSPWSHEKPKESSEKSPRMDSNNGSIQSNKSSNKDNTCVRKVSKMTQDTSGNSNESLIMLPPSRDLDWTPIVKEQIGCQSRNYIRNYEQNYSSKLPKHTEKYHIWQEQSYICCTENTKESCNRLSTSNSDHFKCLSGKLSGIGKFLKIFPRRTKNDT